MHVEEPPHQNRPMNALGWAAQNAAPALPRISNWGWQGLGSAGMPRSSGRQRAATSASCRAILSAARCAFTHRTLPSEAACGGQSREGGGNMPVVGENHVRKEGICCICKGKRLKKGRQSRLERGGGGAGV
eukprot:286316-Prorocentrum_minimum.AAC.3